MLAGLPGLAARPRIHLAVLPTPLHEAARLRVALGADRAPRILLKRDDLTGLAFGGNKARKLEFLVADALREGATHLVTSGGVQSNHARMTAAAARASGLGVSLVLTSPVPEPPVQGNLLLDRLLGAEVHLVAASDDPRLATGPGEAETVERVVADLRDRGERPYVIPLGGSSPVGALGYVAGTLELTEQLAAAGERPSRLYVASGSRGTAAGLVLGATLVDAPYRVHGVAVSGGEPGKTEHAVRTANDAAALIGRPVELVADDFETDQSMIGPGYGLPTAGCDEAIDLLARTEGILLDPVYTGKAMAGLIADIRAGRIPPSETVVFLHTGGTPALFAQAERLGSLGAPAGPIRPG